MSSFVERVKAAEETVKKAKADYRDAITEAEKTLHRIETEHNAAIQTIEREIMAVEEEFARRRGSFENVTLYADHFMHGKRRLELTDTVKAHIETKGQIKARVIGSRTETQDDRELQLVIQMPKERIIVGGNPDEAKKAQDFAEIFVETAATAERNRDEKERHIADLNAKLEATKADTQRSEEAKKDLRDAEADNGAISDAEVELTRLVESASQEELAELALYHKEMRRKDIQKWAIIGAAVLVVIVVVVLIATMR